MYSYGETVRTPPYKGIPFGINFEEMCEMPENLMAGTNTLSMGDDDTGTWNKSTEDGDT